MIFWTGVAVWTGIALVLLVYLVAVVGRMIFGGEDPSYPRMREGEPPRPGYWEDRIKKGR